MNSERQTFLESKILKNEEYFLTHVFGNCKELEEAVYVCCRTAQDRTRMLYKAIKSEVPPHEAKAAFKWAMDEVLMDYGMSVAISEFM